MWLNKQLYRLGATAVALAFLYQAVSYADEFDQPLARKEMKSATKSTVPTDIAAAIKAAPMTGDVYSVTQDHQPFPGQILKVNVLTFQEGTSLVMTNFGVPWVAIAAKKIQFVEPGRNNSIVTDANWSPQRYYAPQSPAQPGKSGKGAQCDNGGHGQPGLPGLTGHKGDNGPPPPKVYLIAGALVDKFNTPLPQSLNFIFDVRGYSGGDGANGGPGGSGGIGGDGGSADYHSPTDYPFDFGCKCGAGYGGDGGTGGRGGPGGTGGDASPGAYMNWIGLQAVLDSFEYARVFNQGGFGGLGGYSGPSGATGSGGARGEWPGTCQGGGAGHSPATPPTPVVQAPGGADKPRGVIDETVVQSVDSFF